ncbi:hypothetical protein CG709_07400 [Lachnotalea glycerini]|nr:hypothetical protein CG709_07400 [Lachnotalea glycerini]
MFFFFFRAGAALGDSACLVGSGEFIRDRVLVYQDMLGMYSDITPKFVKKFGNVGEEMKKAFAEYRKEVSTSVFPAMEHSFTMDDSILNKLY